MSLIVGPSESMVGPFERLAIQEHHRALGPTESMVMVRPSEILIYGPFENSESLIGSSEWLLLA